MTVSEFITILQTLKQDQRICTLGYEGGYEDIGPIEEQELKLNVNTESYNGPHDCPKSWDNEVADCVAYVIERQH